VCIIDEDNAPGTMARNMEDPEGEVSEAQGVLLVNQTCGCDSFNRRESISFLDLGISNHLQVVGVVEHCAFVLARDLCSVPSVVEMAMGQDECMQFAPAFLEAIIEPVSRSFRGINENGPDRSGDEITICLGESACISVDLHGGVLQVGTGFDNRKKCYFTKK